MCVAPSIDRGARAEGPVGVVCCVIIGASQIARSRAADTIHHMPSAELSALTSRDAERGREFADAKDIARVETSLKASLRDPPIDAVYASTADDRRREATLAAEAVGKHVLCEKPFALRNRDAAEMAEACDAAGVRLGGHHHMRGAALHLAIRDLVRSGFVRFRFRRSAKRLTDVGMCSVGWQKMRRRC
jgi:1,5-anhydro-D-fructose reductase (1,5-anhydro-D-mannitol-forming)